MCLGSHCNAAVACTQMTVFMLLLSRLVGWWSALAGVVTTVMVLPVSAWVGSRQSASRERLIALTDARVKLCSEAVSGGMHWACSTTYLCKCTSAGSIHLSMSAIIFWLIVRITRQCCCAMFCYTTWLLAGVKAIKLYAWEEPFQKRIEVLRAAELREIR